MAKGSSKSDATAPTPAEAARKQAAEYVALIDQKKALEDRIEALKAEIVEYADKNADYDLETLTVITGKAKPRIDWGNLTKKAQDLVLGRLKNDLPDYVVSKTELDLEAIFLAKASNPNVANALKAHGVTLVEVDTFTLRKVK